MTLFSTIIQFNELLLFLYLGLMSGLLFYVFKLIFNTLNMFIYKKISKKQLSIDNILTETLNKKRLGFIKFKRDYFKFLKTFSNVVLNIVLAILFALTIITSFFINLKYNFGNISFYYILIWALFFYLGCVVVKTVANFIITFYNYFCKRLKSHEK